MYVIHDAPTNALSISCVTLIALKVKRLLRIVLPRCRLAPQDEPEARLGFLSAAKVLVLERHNLA